MNYKFYNQKQSRRVTRTEAERMLPPMSNKQRLTDEQVAERTGLLIYVPFLCPLGYVQVGLDRVEIRDGVAYQEFDTITQEQYDQEQAAKEAQRIAGLAVAFEMDLRLLQGYLTHIGLSIPVTEREVKGRIATLVADQGLSPDSSIIGNIGVTWNALKEGLNQAGASVDDIEAIWEVLNVVA